MGESTQGVPDLQSPSLPLLFCLLPLFASRALPSAEFIPLPCTLLRRTLIVMRTLSARHLSPHFKQEEPKIQACWVTFQRSHN